MDANALFLVVTLEQRKANDNPPLRDIAKVHPEAKPQAGKIIVAIATCAIPLERESPAMVNKDEGSPFICKWVASRS